MKIGIEAQRIFRKNKHGMDFVILEIIRELQEIDKFNEYFIFVAPGEDRCLKESKNFHIIEIKSNCYPIWEQINLPCAIKRIKPDLLHCTSNTAPINCSVPLLLTLHDIIFLEKQESTNKSLYQEMGRYYRKFVVPKALNKCEKIITVSNYEKNRICKSLHLPGSFVEVVYNGYNKYFIPRSKQPHIVQKYIDSNEFLFFLGNTDPKKNTLRILQAYSIYLKQSKYKRALLIADLKEEYINYILKNENIEDIKPYLKFPGYIPNTDLAAIYNSAFAFLYPSLRESFGIPILESMASGTPVITGNISAMPEIAGEQALLVDPYNPQDIAKKILLLESNKEEYNKSIEYGLLRVKDFSWKKSAESLLEIYNNILKT